MCLIMPDLNDHELKSTHIFLLNCLFYERFFYHIIEKKCKLKILKQYFKNMVTLHQYSDIKFSSELGFLFT